jgi:hypothetical protein
MVDPHFVAMLRTRYDLTDPNATGYDPRTASEKTTDELVRLVDCLQEERLRRELLEEHVARMDAALQRAGVTV